MDGSSFSGQILYLKGEEKKKSLIDWFSWKVLRKVQEAEHKLFLKAFNYSNCITKIFSS